LKLAPKTKDKGGQVHHFKRQKYDFLNLAPREGVMRAQGMRKIDKIKISKTLRQAWKETQFTSKRKIQLRQGPKGTKLRQRMHIRSSAWI